MRLWRWTWIAGKCETEIVQTAMISHWESWIVFLLRLKSIITRGVWCVPLMSASADCFFNLSGGAGVDRPRLFIRRIPSSASHMIVTPTAIRTHVSANFWINGSTVGWCFSSVLVKTHNLQAVSKYLADVPLK